MSAYARHARGSRDRSRSCARRCNATGRNQEMLTVTLNGVATDVAADASTLSDLLTALGLSGKRIAIEKNGEIVPRSRYSTTTIARGDRLEIVGAVGGG